ncbi:LysR family transcriptional regulator [Saccharospirillum salsuginis]|uniref:LysR family transcriptional regulator n=1 Tax=Saccharospirillum salsuginis TaxID=418750 RepID=A0A918NFE8_9GAMM|nr:LysR family transcriptional regulator [Saccharospirillum salsuginis]GGX66518.1 LysR family transcriptional regulator [Saccharospirillum salsuginis]
MNIKLDKLRSFVLVADEGNLTRAAKRRHTTPSAVSEHLRQLEDQFGLPLFERSARGMELTPEGRKLLPPARQALMQIAELDEIARSLRSETPTTLMLGLNAPPEYLKVDQLLRKAARELPEAQLELITSSSYQIADQVREGKMDLGFMYGDPTHEAVKAIRLADIEFCVVGPPDSEHDILPTDPEERRALPWIWASCNCPVSRMMPGIVGFEREQTRVVSSSEDEHVTLSMIRAGLGYGVVEKELSQHWASRGSVRILADAPTKASLNLVVRRDRVERKPIAAVIDMARRLWEESVDLAVEADVVDG